MKSINDCLPTNTMDKTLISDLTIEELRAMIRETVQQSVAEVMIEFATAAEIDAQVTYHAEMSNYLRESIEQSLPESAYARSWELDD